jgi:ATP-binding cassette subfamily B protein
VIEGQLSAGDLVALFSYLQMLIWPLMGAGFMVNMMQRGAVGLTRVNEVLETEPSIISPDAPASIAEAAAWEGVNALEVRNLSFSYGNGAKVLEDISLVVPRGTMLGILGRTGSGKSTLIKALVRMIDPPPGTVLVKGIDLRLWDLSELRRLFGVTPQDSYLFSDSIKNNIGYSVDDPQEELLVKAAETAAIDQDLKAFNLGWDTLIGERGLTLSGGQKQRVAISRAVINSPEILILDDSLSAVDAETEKRILTRLLGERRGKTTIVISHRVSTLRNADQVVVLDKGRIAEYGSPEELARRGGFYAQMAALQQLEQAPPGAESSGEGGHV